LNFFSDFALGADDDCLFDIQVIPRNQEKIDSLYRIEYSAQKKEEEKNMEEFQLELPLDFFPLDFLFSSLEIKSFGKGRANPVS
jgi:hypothetical protein